MAPDLGERARRRRSQHRRTRLLAAVLGGVVVIGGVVGAIALVTREDEPTTKLTKRRAPSTSSSSTSSSTTSTSTTVVPRSTNPVVALAQQYDGYYEGTFTNTTFRTTGKVTLELRIDPSAGTLAVVSTIDGDVFGGGARRVRTIESTVRLGDPTAEVVTQTEAFGAVTARIDANLALVLAARDVPGPEVQGFELVGRLRADLAGFDATYTVTFEDGSTAAGVITVLCAGQGQRPSEVSTLCSPPA